MKSVKLPNTTDNVIVKCRSLKKQTYINGYATMPVRSDINERLRKWEERSKSGKPLSVLMVGIDSISRLNFIRSMPKTAQYVYDNDWFEMSGYNKVRISINRISQSKTKLRIILLIILF